MQGDEVTLYQHILMIVELKKMGSTNNQNLPLVYTKIIDTYKNLKCFIIWSTLYNVKEIRNDVTHNLRVKRHFLWFYSWQSLYYKAGAHKGWSDVCAALHHVKKLKGDFHFCSKDLTCLLFPVIASFFHHVKFVYIYKHDL